MRSVGIRSWCGVAAVVMTGNAAVWANSAPVVSSVTASQRGDASKLVDIHYDLADADGDPCTVWVGVSDSGGASWQVPARTFVGDIGAGIAPGTNKSVVWDAGADMAGKTGSYRVRVWADDGQGPAAKVLVPGGAFPYQNTTNPSQWVYVDTFLIDKYEVTNGFYCQFLNSGGKDDHWFSDMEIIRQGNPGSYYYIVTADKGGYPVRNVNYYDAEAFAVWRSAQEGVTWRLPTQQEWAKAAAWDPVQQHHYLYGFHQDTISCPWCTYSSCAGTNNTTPVGYYNGTIGFRISNANTTRAGKEARTPV